MMNSSHDAWQVFALGGLVFYLFSRMARRSRTISYYEGFGTWLRPPGWARRVFGGPHGRIRWDVLSWEMMSLVCMFFGGVGWVLQPPTRSFLYVVVGLPIVESIFLLGVVLVIVRIGRRNRW